LGKAKRIGIRIGIGIGIVIIAFFATAFYGLVLMDEEKQAEQKKLEATSNFEINERLAVSYEYEDLIRNIEDFNGEIIRVKGKVTIPSKNGVFGVESENSSGVLSFCEADMIFVEYKKERFRINDYVDGFGYVDGLRNCVWTNSFSDTQAEDPVPNVEGFRFWCTSCGE